MPVFTRHRRRMGVFAETAGKRKAHVAPNDRGDGNREVLADQNRALLDMQFEKRLGVVRGYRRRRTRAQRRHVAAMRADMVGKAAAGIARVSRSNAASGKSPTASRLPR